MPNVSRRTIEGDEVNIEPHAQAFVDREQARLRDYLDAIPFARETLLDDHGPWHDAAGFVVRDLMSHRHDDTLLLLRLWAWAEILGVGC